MPRLPHFVVRKFLAMQVDAAVGKSVEQMRENVDRVARRMPRLADVGYEPTTIAGLAAEWCRPVQVEARRAVLFVHGGGYQLGSLDSHRDLAARVARASRAVTLAIDYRRAPEHVHPAARDDVVAAHRALIDEHGFAPRRVAIVGDSAGGNLAICAALRLRDDGDALPGALACMSAWTDLSCASASLQAGQDPTVKPEYVAEMARSYLGDHDARAPDVSPLYADVSNLPPVLLQAGGADALLDDSRRFAAHCQAAGVDVTLDVWPGMFHAFQVWAVVLADARRAIERLGEFVRTRTEA